MIDSKGYLRCESCNTILGRNLEGKIEIICYRSKCHRNNVFRSREYSSYKLLGLTTEVKDDKNIDWGDRDNLSLTDRQGKILASVGKIQKDNAKLADDTRKQEFTDLEARLRKDFGLDSVDTTTSAGVVSGSDAEFMGKFGSGDLPMTKANTDRYNKIKNKYQ